jgi:hypothetical protein
MPTSQRMDGHVTFPDAPSHPRSERAEAAFRRRAGYRGDRHIRGITADNDNSLRVLPANGLSVRDTAGRVYAVPTGAKYTSWRISRSGGRLPAQLPDRKRKLCNEVDRADERHVVVLHWFQDRQGGASAWLMRPYRGSVALIKRGTGGRTINNVLLEDYVRGVVPAEMPTLWAANAVRAGGRGTVLRRPAAEVRWILRVRHLRHHRLSGLRRDGSRDQWRQCGG